MRISGFIFSRANSLFKFALRCCTFHWDTVAIWAPSSEFVSSSIPSLQILIAHAQPFRGARDLVFCLKVPLDSLLVWASSEGSGETARMRRLTWTFAARISDKYQIRLSRSIWNALGLDKTNTMTCAPSEDSDQLGRPSSLIKIFAVWMKRPLVLGYPMRAQWRLIRLCWRKGWFVFFRRTPFCWFCRAPAQMACFLKKLEPYKFQRFLFTRNAKEWTMYWNILND